MIIILEIISVLEKLNIDVSFLIRSFYSDFYKSKYILVRFSEDVAWNLMSQLQLEISIPVIYITECE